MECSYNKEFAQNFVTLPYLYCFISHELPPTAVSLKKNGNAFFFVFIQRWGLQAMEYNAKNDTSKVSFSDFT